MKDREEVMDNVAIHEDWRPCLSQLAPGLVLSARQWVHSAADAEDIVQDAFVKFWRRNHNVQKRGLLYDTVRSTAADLILRDSRRARRDQEGIADLDQTVEPQFRMEDESQRALAA